MVRWWGLMYMGISGLFVRGVTYIMNTAIDQEERPKLVYLRSRGNGQVIRMAMMEIGIEYDDVFVSHKTGIPQEYKNKYNLDIANMPFLIHRGLVIYQSYPILKYLCLHFGRSDLIGKTLVDQVRVAEVFVKYSSEKNKMLKAIYQGIDIMIKNKLGDAGIMEMRKTFKLINESMKFCQASAAMFRKSKGFILGYMTIIDLVYYEHNFNMTHLYDCHPNSPAVEFRQFFESTDFYRINQDKINEYKVFFVQEVSPEMAAIFHKLWRGDYNYYDIVNKQEDEDRMH